MFTRKLEENEIRIIKKLFEFIKKKHSNEMGHDYSHVVEVCRWAVEIGMKIQEPVDPFITICGALLHDIGRIGAQDGSFHGIDGGSRAREYLEVFVEDPQIIRKITNLVVRHTPTSMIPPRTAEEKIVCDADGIERLGLLGLIRGIMNKKGSMEYIIQDRVRKRMNDFNKLHFKESKELAKPYYRETLQTVVSFEKALRKRRSLVEQMESWKLFEGKI